MTKEASGNPLCSIPVAGNPDVTYRADGNYLLAYDNSYDPLTNAGAIASDGWNPRITTDRGNKKDISASWNVYMNIDGQSEFVVLCKELYP